MDQFQDIYETNQLDEEQEGMELPPSDNSDLDFQNDHESQNIIPQQNYQQFVPKPINFDQNHELQSKQQVIIQESQQSQQSRKINLQIDYKNQNIQKLPDKLVIQQGQHDQKQKLNQAKPQQVQQQVNYQVQNQQQQAQQKPQQAQQQVNYLVQNYQQQAQQKPQQAQQQVNYQVQNKQQQAQQIPQQVQQQVNYLVQNQQQQIQQKPQQVQQQVNNQVQNQQQSSKDDDLYKQIEQQQKSIRMLEQGLRQETQNNEEQRSYIRVLKQSLEDKLFNTGLLKYFEQKEQNSLNQIDIYLEFYNMKNYGLQKDKELAEIQSKFDQDLENSKIYTNQIKNLKDENSELKDQVQQLQDEISHTLNTLNETTAQNQSFKEKWIDVQKYVEGIKKKLGINIVKTNLVDNIQLIDKQIKDYTKFQDQLNSKDFQINEITSELEETKFLSDEIEKQRQNLVVQNEELFNELQNIKNKLGGIKSGYDQTMNENKQSKNSVDDLNKQIQNLQDQNQTQINRYEQLKANYTTMEGMLKETQNELSQAQEFIQSVQESDQELLLKNVQNDLQSRVEQMQLMKQIERDHLNLIESLKEKIEHLNEEKLKIEESYNNLLHETCNSCDDLRYKTINLMDELQNAKNKNSENISVYEKQLEQLIDQNRKQTQEIIELNQKISNEQSNSIQITKKNQDEVANLFEQLSNIRSDMRSYKEQVEVLTKDNKRIVQEKESLNDQYQRNKIALTQSQNVANEFKNLLDDRETASAQLHSLQLKYDSEVKYFKQQQQKYQEQQKQNEIQQDQIMQDIDKLIAENERLTERNLELEKSQDQTLRKFDKSFQLSKNLYFVIDASIKVIQDVNNQLKNFIGIQMTIGKSDGFSEERFELQNGVDELRNLVSDCLDKFNEFSDKTTEYALQNQDIERKYYNQKQLLDEYQHQQSQFQKDYQEIKQENQNLQNSLAIINKRADFLEKENSQSNFEMNQLKNQCNQYVIEIKKLQKDYENIILNDNTQESQLRKDIKTLQKSLEQVQNEKESMKSYIKDLEILYQITISKRQKSELEIEIQLQQTLQLDKPYNFDNKHIQQLQEQLRIIQGNLDMFKKKKMTLENEIISEENRIQHNKVNSSFDMIHTTKIQQLQIPPSQIQNINTDQLSQQEANNYQSQPRYNSARQESRYTSNAKYKSYMERKQELQQIERSRNSLQKQIDHKPNTNLQEDQQIQSFARKISYDSFDNSKNQTKEFYQGQRSNDIDLNNLQLSTHNELQQDPQYELHKIDLKNNSSQKTHKLQPNYEQRGLQKPMLIATEATRKYKNETLGKPIIQTQDLSKKYEYSSKPDSEKLLDSLKTSDLPKNFKTLNSLKLNFDYSSFKKDSNTSQKF